MLGGALKLAGAVLLRNSLAVSHVPCTIALVQIAILITEICFHDHSLPRHKPHTNHLSGGSVG
jgi:type III secretory pathway component EscR